MTSRSADVYDAHQRARWIRPDAERYTRSDAERWLVPPHPDERKYSPSQPRVQAGSGRESGRWSGGGDGISNSRGEVSYPDPLLPVQPPRGART